MKILIADDSGMMRTIQRICFKRMGIENVVEVKNGKQALELIDQSDFDLITTDWRMPVMDGVELVQEIRKRGLDLPVIMITSETEKCRVVTAINAGVSDYIVKPFTRDELQLKLSKWIEIEV